VLIFDVSMGLEASLRFFGGACAWRCPPGWCRWLGLRFNPGRRASFRLLVSFAALALFPADALRCGAGYRTGLRVRRSACIRIRLCQDSDQVRGVLGR
jgi:hypothetical protein